MPTDSGSNPTSSCSPPTTSLPGLPPGEPLRQFRAVLRDQPHVLGVKQPRQPAGEPRVVRVQTLDQARRLVAPEQLVEHLYHLQVTRTARFLKSDSWITTAIR